MGYEDDINLYTYARNDGANLFDPSGMEAPCISLNTDCYSGTRAPAGMYEFGGSVTIPWGGDDTRGRYGQTRIGVSVYATVDQNGDTTDTGLHIQFSPTRFGLERGGGVGVQFTPGPGAPPRRSDGSSTITGGWGILNFEWGRDGPSPSVQLFGFGMRTGLSGGISTDIYIPFENQGQRLQSVTLNAEGGTMTAAYGGEGSRLVTRVTQCVDQEKCGQ